MSLSIGLARIVPGSQSLPPRAAAWGRAQEVQLGYLRTSHEAGRGLKGEDDGRAATCARSSANQSGRKGVAGAVQQFGDGAPQSRGIHAQFCLHFPEWRAGEAANQCDRQSGARKAHLAGAGREYLPLRDAVRANQGSARRQRAAAERRICAVKQRLEIES